MDDLLRLCLRARRDPSAFAAVEALAGAGEIDWDSLLNRAETERVGPLLHSTFAQARFLPSSVAETWQRAHRATALFYVVWSGALTRISAALARENIPFIVLKGAALAEAIYAKPSLRPLADIDVLVPRERAAAALEVLQANGYDPPRAAESQGYTLDFENEIALVPRNTVGVAIDVHWSLFDSPYYQRALSHDWFWESSVPLPGYGAARMLGPEAQLLHLSTHLMVHHHGKGVLWLHDIVELLHRHRASLDWDRTFAEALRCELVLSLQQTLGRAIGELGAEVEPTRRAQLSQLQASAEEHRVFKYPTIGIGTAAHFWNDVITLPDWRTRAVYIARRVAPAPAFMRQRYQIRRLAYLPLYYLYRWLLGGSQLLGVLVSRLARQGQRDTNDAFPGRENHG
jgi:hypothetical protein